MNPSSPPEGKHRIVLLGNDPADSQWSMLEYGKQLHRALSVHTGGKLQVALRFPDSRRLGPWLRGSRPGRAAAMYLSRYLSYPQLLRREKFDLYHILDHGNAWLVGLLDPRKTLVTCHDLIPLVLEGWKRSSVPWLSRRAFHQALEGLHRADRVIADSSCTRQDLISRAGLPPERITVIPLGVDPDLRPPSSAEESPQIRRMFHLPSGMLLLHVSQNVFYKNIEGLLHALQILTKRGESVRLVRAGPLLDPVQRALANQLGVRDSLLELGPLTKSQLHSLYRAADLFVYPSWYEGFGLPPLEAMASGLPVVVSNRGSLPETVGEAGLQVDPDAPERIAEAVQRLLHDERLRENLRVRGLQRAAQFRWEETAEQTLRLYRSLLS